MKRENHLCIGAIGLGNPTYEKKTERQTLQKPLSYFGVAVNLPIGSVAQLPIRTVQSNLLHGE